MAQVKVYINPKEFAETISFITNSDEAAYEAGRRIGERGADYVKRSARANLSSSKRWAASGMLGKSLKSEWKTHRSGKHTKSESMVITAAAYNKDGKNYGEFQSEGYVPHYVQIKYLSIQARQKLKDYAKQNKGPKVGKGGFKGYIHVSRYAPFFPTQRQISDKIDAYLHPEVDAELNKLK